MAPKKHVRAGTKRKSQSKFQSKQLSKREKKELREYGEFDPLQSGNGSRLRYTRIEEEEVKKQEEEDFEESSEEELDAYQLLLSSVTRTSGQGEIESETEEESDKEEDKAENEDRSHDEEEIDSSEEDEGVEEEDGGEEDDGEDQEEDNEILEKDDDREDFVIKDSDPFSAHCEHDLEDKFAESLNRKQSWKKEEIKVKHLGRIILTRPVSDHNHSIQSTGSVNNLTKLYVKQKLSEGVMSTNKSLCNVTNLKDEAVLTPLQSSLFSILNKYQDLHFPNRSHDNGEELRLVYCLHALNHVLKTRSRVITHNTKIKLRQAEHDTEDYRDQGLMRPKVLVVLPFRDSALKVVNIMIKLLMSSDQSMVSNKKRFQDEYGEEETDKKANKPEDFEKTFTGNIDDHFRIGLGVAKKTLKLYTKFYSSDIILASPLGLRTVIGSEGDKERDYDFLNSIELLIFDQADIFLMQNWDHITHLMNHLHLQPQDSHGVDFSRVRMWNLNGWSKYYRQTLIFSSLSTPELSALFNKHCWNYEGKLSVCKKDTKGTICHIVTQLPQVFQRLDCTSYAEMADTRFNFFVKKILPTQKDAVMSQTLIFVPSYFDYVRIRNYFVKEDLEFSQINEYSSNKTISRSRNEFFHGKVHFMLYTERIHFYRRLKLRGIRHIVFYELPRYAHVYSELCNMLQDKRNQSDNMTCTVIYSNYDAHRLADVVGSERASQMVNSAKKVHMFVTGENT